MNKNIKVLYVEDTLDTREELTTILEMFVDEVITAVDGADGLKMFQKHSPDIIITDIQMPKMSGLEMISEIRKEDINVPIIVTSAFNDNNYLLQAIDSGIEYYLIKPVSIDKLENKLDKIIDLIIQKRKVIEYNKYLAHKLEQEKQLREEKEQLLIEQNKYAEIGRMVGVIAHQWKQPLHYVNLLIEDIALESEYNPLTKEYIQDFVQKGTSRINFLSETMDNFLSFYRTNPNKTDYSAHKVVKDIVNFLSISFDAIGLKVQVSFENDFILHGVENEFQQIILNLLNNAKEAFTNNINKDSNIHVRIYSQDKIGIIEISDNATGISEEIINDIFELNYTTKETGNGIGLYLVKKIISEKLHGSIKASNLKDGALFTLTFDIGKIH